MNKMNMKKTVMSVISFLLVSALLSVIVSAQVPKKLNYQGYLADASGIPVTGTVTITFAIYDVATGGTALWTEIRDVNVLTGKFSVHLGEITPIELEVAKPYYLGVRIGTEAEITPREELTSSMYAIFANKVEGITVENGNVSIGTTESNGSLTINSPWGDWIFLRQERSTQGGGGFHIHNPWKNSDDESRNRLEIAYQPVGGVGQWGQFVLHGPTGNVGIGTVTPADKLEVANGWIVPAGGYGLNWRDNIWGGSGDDAWIRYYAESGEDTKLQIGNNNDGDDDISFYQANAERMVIKDGNVGIGTTNPADRLEVANGWIIPAGGYGLNWRDNIWGGSGDDAWIRYYSEDGENTKLQIGNNNDGDDDLSFYQAGAERMVIKDGNVGIDTTSPGEKLDVNGTTRTRILQITGGSDIAEPFEITGTTIELGMVVAIDPQRPGQLRIPDQEYDRTVAGIISGAGGIKPGLTLQQDNSVANGAHPVAMSGRVYCWADASYGPIEPGDLLTTSATPGHAMKVVNYEKAQGAILGKAMSSLTEGKGLILVLVTLQ